VAPLKKAHRQLKDLGLADGERKLLAAFWRRTGSTDLVLVYFPAYFAFDYDPGSTLGTSYARAHDVIRHATSV
jgi:hypothetical protein